MRTIHAEHRVRLFWFGGKGGGGGGEGEREPQSQRRITVGAAKRIIDASVLMASPPYITNDSRVVMQMPGESTQKALRIYEP